MDIEMVVKKLEKNNCNMADNVLNNGAGEKIQWEAVRAEQEQSADRTSLKSRLTEKKVVQTKGLTFI